MDQICMHVLTCTYINKCLSRSKIRPELTRWRETDRSQIKTSLSRHKKKKKGHGLGTCTG